MAGLDPSAITEAAMAVADERGPNGLTMRAVADVLGVTPMAIYHHVENKAALVALVVESAMRAHPLPEPTGQGWKEDLWELAKWCRDDMTAHPAIANLRLRYKVWTPSILALGEHWLNLWQQSGLQFEAATQGALASSFVIVGVVQQEMALREFEPPDEKSLAWLPSMRSLFRSGSSAGVSFEFIVRSFIDGIYDKLAREAAAQADDSREKGEVVELTRSRTARNRSTSRAVASPGRGQRASNDRYRSTEGK